MDTRIQSEHKINWTASLSNGASFFEGKGEFAELEGAKSPFQKLIDYTIDNQVEIRSFGLYCDKKVWMLPSLSPRYQIGMLDKELKPLGYNLFRYVDADLNGNNADENGTIHIEKRDIKSWWTVAEAIYPDFKLQIWVNEFNVDVSRVHIVPIKS